MSEQRTFTVAEAAEETGYSEETIRRHCRNGTLRAAGGGKQGRVYRISRRELARWWRDEMGGGELFEDSPLDDKTNSNEDDNNAE
jgi:excisionase family DNA binding protein